MVTDNVKLLLPSNSKLCMGFRLAYAHSTLTNFEGQGQGYALSTETGHYFSDLIFVRLSKKAL